MRYLIAGILSTLTLSAASQTVPPLGFKDLVIGQPLAQSALAKRLKCKADGYCYYFSKYSSGAPETIAGAQLDNIMVALTNGVIEMVNIGFKPDDFEQVHAALSDKYAGLKCERSLVQNRMGASFDQIKCSLSTADGGLISLMKRSNNVDEAELFFYSAAHQAEFAKKRTGSRKDL